MTIKRIVKTAGRIVAAAELQSSQPVFRIGQNISNVASAAQLQSGNYLTGQATVYRGSQLIGRSRIIDHLGFNDLSSVFAFIDYFLTTDSVILLLARVVPVIDTLTVADRRVSLTTVKGITENIVSIDTFKRVITARRGFQDTVNAADVRRFAITKSRIDSITVGDVRYFNITKSRIDSFSTDDVHRLAITKSRIDSFSTDDVHRLAITKSRIDSFSTDDVRRFAIIKSNIDSFNVGDVRSFVLGIGKTDAVSFSDVHRFAITKSRIDAVSFSDDHRFAITKSNIDSIVPVDVRSFVLGIGKIDAVTSTDSTRRAASYIRRPSNDEVSIAELIRQIADYSRNHYDTQSLSDNRVFAVAALKRDTQTIADRREFVIGRALLDPAVFATDATSKLTNKGRSDAVIPEDVRGFNFAKARTDAFNIAEQRTFFFNKGLDLGPDLIMLDSKRLTINKVFADTTVMLDLTNVFDGITYNTVLNKIETQIIADYAALSNSVVRGPRDGFADALSLSDIISRVLGKFAYLADTTTISDARRFLIGKSLTNTVTPSEAIAKQVGKRAAPDTATMSDVRAVSSIKGLADVEVLTDSRKFTIGNLRTDDFSQLDRVYKTIGNLRTDQATLSDLRRLATDKGRFDIIVNSDTTRNTAGKGIADSNSINDLGISRSMTMRRFDAASMSDAFARIYGRALGLTDSIGNIDALLLTRGKVPVDSIVMGSGLNQRQSEFERISFAITRLLRDSTIMLDQAGIYDGQNNQVAIFKTDQFSIGADSNYNDNTPFIRNYQTVPENIIGRTSIVYAGNSWILSSPNVDSFFMAYGEASVYSSSISKLVRSTDLGATWTSITLNEAAGPVGYNVAVNDTGTVVLAVPKYSAASINQKVWRSLDAGTTWLSSTTTIPAYQTTLAATIWANGYWFAFNAARSNLQSSSSYYYSTDNAISWSSSAITVPANSSVYLGIQSVAFGAGVLFALHPGFTTAAGFTTVPKLVYLTTDNMPNGSWADCTPANLGWSPRQVAFGAGKFAVLTYVWATSTAVTVGSDGWYVLTSPDLTNWTASTRSLPFADDIIFADNRFWVIDLGGINIYYSTDGLSWSTYNNVGISVDPVYLANEGSTLAFGNNQIAIVDTHMALGLIDDYFNDNFGVVYTGTPGSWFSIYDVATGDRGYTLPSIRNHARETVALRPNKSLRDSIATAEQLSRSTGTGLRDSFAGADYFSRIVTGFTRLADSQTMADQPFIIYGKNFGIRYFVTSTVAYRAIKEENFSSITIGAAPANITNTQIFGDNSFAAYNNAFDTTSSPAIAASGAGTGGLSGFNTASIGGVNYLAFSGAAPRTIFSKRGTSSNNIFVSSDLLTFYAIRGTGDNGGDSAEEGEDLFLSWYYFTSGNLYASLAQEIIIFDTSNAIGISSWVQASIEIPEIIRTSYRDNTVGPFFTISQPVTSGGLADTYGLARFAIYGTGFGTATTPILIDTVSFSETFDTFTAVGRSTVEELIFDDVFAYVWLPNRVTIDNLPITDSLKRDSTKSLRETQSMGFGSSSTLRLRVSGDNLERTSFDFTLTAYRGFTSSNIIQTLPGLNGSLSSVAINRGTRSPDQVGVPDGLRRAVTNLRIDDATVADTDRLSIGLLKTDEVVVTVPTNFSSITVTSELVTVTTSFTIITDGYLSSVALGASYLGSTMFTSSAANTVGTTVVTAGTGSGSAGGFSTYRHIQFSNPGGASGAQTRKFNLTTATSISYQYIVGNGSNGGSSPAGGFQLYYRVGSGIYVSFDTVTTTSVWTTRTVSLPAPARVNDVDLVWYRNPGASTLDYGLTNARIDGDTATVITYTTSVVTSIIIITPDRPPRNTNETQTFDITKRRFETATVVDAFRRATITSRPFVDLLSNADRPFLGLTKFNSSILVRAGINYDQRSAAEENINFTVTKQATVGTDPQLMGFGSSLSTGLRVSGSNLERTVLDVALLMKQGANSTVSGVTIAASALGERLFVGQQYGGNRFSGDAQERIQFSSVLPKFETLLLGSGQDQRQRAEERISFAIDKRFSSSNTVYWGTEATPSSYNLYNSSENITLQAFGGAWENFGGVILSNDTALQVAPDGTFTADRVNSGGAKFRNRISVTSSTNYVWSFYYYSFGAGDYSVSTLGPSTSTLVGASSYTITAGWNRAIVPFTTPASASQVYLNLGDSQVQGFIWGMQLNTGTTATAYVRTTSTALTSLTVGYDLQYPPGLGETVIVSERPAKFLSLTAKQGANSTVSGVTIAASALGETLKIGQQYTGAYRANDGLERIQLSSVLGKFETVSAGISIDGRSISDAETVKFTVAKRNIDTIITDFDRPALNFNLTAYRGVAGSVTFNTIDPNPDIEYQQSSVTINRGTRSRDEVGMLDSFFLTYAVGRIISDNILIGSYQDQRQRAEERISFVITKLLTDAAVPDDFLQTFDGLTYSSTIFKTDRVTPGLGLAIRVSGSNTERTSFDVALLTKAGAAFTVSGVTVAAAASGDRLFVGQQYGGNRFSGDAQERISFAVGKTATLNTEAVTAGVNYDQRSANEERSFFTVAKRATVGTDPITAGLGMAIRVSGSDVERTPFDVTKLMKAGTAYTVSGVTVAAAANGDRLFIGQQYGGNRFSGDNQERIVFAATKLTSDATRAGIDYDQRSANEERSFFTIGKLATVGTDPVTMGFGSSLSTGLRVSGSNLERTSFNIGLLAYRGAAGTLTLKTIDIPGPDSQSSITINQAARNPDFVGTIDFLSLFTATGRSVADIFLVGSGQDQRQRAEERISFAITKLLQDSPIMLDQTTLSDGLTYAGTIFKTDRTTVGLGMAIRAAGSDQERTSFDIALLMKQGVNFTVSGITIAAAARGETLRIGQQYGGNRFSGDAQERISFSVGKLTSDATRAGIDYDQRSAAEERSFFTVAKRATLGTDPQFIGFGSSLSTGLRVSGNDLERVSMNLNLLTKQGANFTVSGVTIAAAARGETLRIGQQYGATRFSGDAQERIALDVFKSLEAGSNSSIFAATDRTRTSSLFVRGAAFTQENQPMLELKALLISKTIRGGNFNIFNQTGGISSLAVTVSSMSLTLTSTMTAATITGGDNDDGYYAIAPGWDTQHVFDTSRAATSATVYFSTNGYMTLSSSVGDLSPLDFPDAPIYRVHATDLVVHGAWYSITGTTPNRVLNFRQDAQLYGQPASSTISYEYRFYEASPRAVSILVGANTLAFGLLYESGVWSQGVLRKSFTNDAQTPLANTSFTITHSPYSETAVSSTGLDAIAMADSVAVSNLLFRTLTDRLIGDLDPFGNINTLDSRGILRMTSYADIEYFAEDYVGESRSFT